jgi:hypothetical protein
MGAWMNANSKADPTRDTVTPDGVYTRYTVGITVVYLFIVAIAFFGGHIGKSTDMDPNEWGDLAAGIFAPLAWLWLAVGYYLQRLELKEQRLQLTATSKAAQSQAQQQENQAIAMANLVEVTRLQSEVAKRQLEIQEKLLRIGTRPRFSVECTDSTEPHRILRVRNAGAFAPDVGLSTLRGGKVSSCCLPGNYVDVEPESTFVVVLIVDRPGSGADVIFRLRMGLSDTLDVSYMFQVLTVGPCAFLGKELIRLQ